MWLYTVVGFVFGFLIVKMFFFVTLRFFEMEIGGIFEAGSVGVVVSWTWV